MLSNKFGWVIVLVAALGSIALASYFNQRIDLTGEKRYTISPASKKMLNELQAPVEITVLLKDENLSSGFRKLANSTESFLSDCRSISNGKLVYRFVAPDDFLADSIAFPLNDTFKITWLKSNAIKQNEVTKSGSAAVFHYPIALVKTGDDFTTVNLLEGQGNKGFLNPDAAGLQYETINNAEAQMEYLFASAIQTLSHREAPMVAYATGNGEPMGPETYDLSQTLQSKYRFFLLNLQQQPFISDSIKALVIVKPSVAFSDADKLKIDQYMMRGGKVLFLLDALHADMDSLVRSGKDFTAYGRDLRIDDLIFKYGARINQNLAQDRQSDVLPQAVGNVGEQPQIELLPWPYFPLLYSQSSHPISKNLDAVVMQFPNSIDTVKAEGISKTILLSTSNTSRILSAPAIVTVEILKQLENPSEFKQEAVPLAVLLEGHFKSLYANRLSKTVIDSLQAVGQPYLPTASKPGQVLVTGDGDWVLNGFTREGPLAMGTNPYTQYQFANRNFLLNAIDFMTDESGIISTRSKEYTLRLLDPKKLETGKGMWQAINIALPLLLLLLSGIVVNLVRRKKYS